MLSCWYGCLTEELVQLSLAKSVLEVVPVHLADFGRAHATQAFSHMLGKLGRRNWTLIVRDLALPADERLERLVELLNRLSEQVLDVHAL